MSALSLRRDGFQGYSLKAPKVSFIAIKQAEASANAAWRSETKAYCMDLIQGMETQTCLYVAFRLRQNLPFLTRSDAYEVRTSALKRARKLILGVNQ